MPEAREEREPACVPFASLINKSGNTVTLHTERPFRMLSTASDGPGFSWSRRLSGSAAAGLICRTFDSVTIAVTAQYTVWVLISGRLSEQGFVRLLTAAAEARMQALSGRQAKATLSFVPCRQRDNGRPSRGKSRQKRNRGMCKSGGRRRNTTMKLYTKTGDQGQTSLIGGRTDKDSLRVESYGTIDELNSFIGLALAELDDCEIAVM